MLRVARLTARTGAYYLADLAPEVHVVGPELAVTVHGRWTGAGAGGLGLSGPVDQDGLDAILSGCHPRFDRPLRRAETVVSGYDLTFAAPKSVSVVFGLGEPATAAEVVAAHESAVEAALGYVERRAATVRRGTGEERRVEPADGVVAASFTHGASRALDPHLHTHVVVANVVHGADGRWTALDGRALYAHAAAAGALYDAHLRHELGAQWSLRRSGGYELTSVDASVVGAFSARQAEIRSHLHARARPVRAAAGVPPPPASRRQRAVAWAATRDDKPTTLDVQVLRRSWRERAGALGATVPELGWVTTTRQLPAAGRLADQGRFCEVDEHRFAAGLVTVERRGPARRDAVSAWAGALARGAPAVAVERCVEMLAPWGAGTGVSEPSVRRSDLVPAPHLVRALGPRPSDPVALDVWKGAAAAIDRYRARWALDGASGPLGADDPVARARMPARRLADHLRAERQIADARRLLGRSAEREPVMPERELGR